MHQRQLLWCRWWAQWCAYTKFKQPQSSTAGETSSDTVSGLPGSPSPAGPQAPDSIDNTDIVADTKLRDNLEEGRHFVIVSDQHHLVTAWQHGCATQDRM